MILLLLVMAALAAATARLVHLDLRRGACRTGWVFGIDPVGDDFTIVRARRVGDTTRFELVHLAGDA